MAFMKLAFLGDKGGSGKTTLAHCAAAGMRDFDGAGIYVLTDNRMLLPSDERWYDVLCGDDIPLLCAKADAVADRGLLVIDGAGGNPEADAGIASVCDVVLLPMTADEDSMRTVALDFARISQINPATYILPNRWTSNSFASAVDADYLQMLTEVLDIPSEHVLPPLPQVHAAAEFVRSAFAGEVLPRARQFCRLLTGMCLDLGGYPREAQADEAA